jgi:hypothetical protein
VTLVRDYTTLAELKAHLRITDTTDDAILAVHITAASRAVDQFTYRRFGQSASATARVFTADGGKTLGDEFLALDDIQTTTGLVVKSDTAGDYTYATTLVLGTDFDMYPADAPDLGVPWTGIVMRRTATALPTHRAGMQVTASWGWTAVPSVVEIATLIQAARFFVRRDSAYGVAGSPDLGNELRLQSALDVDVQVALQSVLRYWGGVAA